MVIVNAFISKKILVNTLYMRYNPDIYFSFLTPKCQGLHLKNTS